MPMKAINVTRCDCMSTSNEQTRKTHREIFLDEHLGVKGGSEEFRKLGIVDDALRFFLRSEQLVFYTPFGDGLERR
jgi:hypothetical protein